MSLTPELRKHFGAPHDRGVIVAQVIPGTPAAKAGVAVGDVVVEVRGRKIETASDVLSAVEDLGKGEHVKISVLRDHTPRSLDATLGSEAATNAAWAPPLLRDWMKPFDDPNWSRLWMSPHEQATPDTDPATASTWMRRLRELFKLENAAPTHQRS